MLIRINKETRLVEEYINVGKPSKIEGTELIEVDNIPTDWQYCKYENNQFVLDQSFKQNTIAENELREIRIQREIECFPYINRGTLWYELLTEEQKTELKEWYQKWLDAPATKEIPTKPTWLE